MNPRPHRHLHCIAAVVLALAGGTPLGASSTTVEFSIDSPDDFARVEAQLAASDAERVVVRVLPGRYTLSEAFDINRSNVTMLGGEGVVLRLASGAECPVIALGTRKEYPEAVDEIENIRVQEIEIDGNRENQPSELERVRPWIRNNGIDARRVTRLVLEQVSSNNNRSGGFVISWGCEDVLVVDSSFKNNYFDGLAYYDSRRVYTINCDASSNRSAGVSLDNKLVDALFVRCRLQDNGDVGVFARNGQRLYFVDCIIQNSGDWAVFFAHDGRGLGISDSAVLRCRLSGNDGGIRMASITEQQSSGVVVSGNQFQGNGRSGRGNLDTCGSPLERREAYDLVARLKGMDTDREQEAEARRQASEPWFGESLSALLAVPVSEAAVDG